MKKRSAESRSKGISYTQYKKDKWIGHNCVLKKHIFKERYLEGYTRKKM